jgi:hypothetical protein
LVPFLGTNTEAAGIPENQAENRHKFYCQKPGSFAKIKYPQKLPFAFAKSANKTLWTRRMVIGNQTHLWEMIAYPSHRSKRSDG